MNSQFTIRLDNVTNEKTIESAKSLNITRATLVRNALTSYLDKQNPNQDSSNKRKPIELLELLSFTHPVLTPLTAHKA